MITNTKERAEKELKGASLEYEKLYDKKFGALFLIKEKKIIICELKLDYVPIEKFKKIFGVLSEFIKEYNINKFIFDKRNLEVFHQPSMEWYFLSWKEEMLNQGLTIHRKILPEGNVWFKEAVLAGRDEIMKKNPSNIINQLDIQYSNSIREAIDK